MGYHQINDGPNGIEYHQPMIIRQIISLYLVIQIFSVLIGAVIGGVVMFFMLLYGRAWLFAFAAPFMAVFIAGMSAAVGWAVIDWDKNRVLRLRDGQGA